MNSPDEERDWLTDMDFEILEVMRFELILSPSIIAENIGRSREGVSKRLGTMQAGELVKKVDRGKYRITEDGLLVWRHEGDSKYKNRRAEVTHRKMIQRDLGVSVEEYHQKVQQEYAKMEGSSESVGLDSELLELACERVEERLRD
jgi:DNA-binding transcriptional regulator GbsR (MarR family)